MSIGFRHMLQLIEAEIKENEIYASSYDLDKLKSLCSQVYLIASSSDSVALASQNEIKNKIDHVYDLVKKEL
ncbi:MULTISPECIES: hypothetical protein [Vibrio]|uniref:Uncharacterized protein n=1 Tax=Vibrio atlanticus TaxID=693153 RepID=A0A1C3IJV8_9VIBR|nr:MULTISPECIES: hypothetical protein [Vibrio]PMN84564.1 hypothetical protein BCT24_01015 [Vibrio splendidus]SBS61721.1 hypothetical protein VAT7223_00800 [Vibrio atlanticus]